MARAGYDPEEALALWERMEAKGSQGPWEFLSTHPSPATRRAQIREWLPAARLFYADRSRPLPATVAELERALAAERLGPPAATPPVGPRPGPSAAPATTGAVAAVAPASRLTPTSAERPTSDHTWLLGSWHGTHRGLDAVPGATRFEFTMEGTRIRWRMSRSGVPRAAAFGEASGTALSVSASWAELEGTTPGGQAIRYSISKLGEELEGVLVVGPPGPASLRLQRGPPR